MKCMLMPRMQPDLSSQHMQPVPSLLHAAHRLPGRELAVTQHAPALSVSTSFACRHRADRVSGVGQVAAVKGVLVLTLQPTGGLSSVTAASVLQLAVVMRAYEMVQGAASLDLL